MFSGSYTLYKSYQILASGNKIYQKKRDFLAPTTRQEMQSTLSSLQEAILLKNRKQADISARKLEELTSPYAERAWWRFGIELVLTVFIALLAATLIRQMWFEHYKIPTGSMRPTLREEDCLTVTKTAFGINNPLETSHLYFDPSLVLRTGIFTFTADGLDMSDTDTRYFWLFPAKKQVVKRCMGLPGDSLYFYGGKMYGVNEKGEDITPLLNPDWMEPIDHIPFINFLGRHSFSPQVGNPKTHELLIRQMNLPIAKLLLSSHNTEGQIQVGGKWIPDDPSKALEAHTQPVTYSDFFGIGNFAMARLLKAAEAEGFYGPQATALAKAPYYLELHHHPSLRYPLPRIERGMGNGFNISLPGFVSLLPLEEAHIAALRQGLYTVRFVVNHGKATAYSIEGSPIDKWSPSMSGVPDGTYEFYYGKAYEVGFWGWLTELDASHPVAVFATKHFPEMFNLGIEMHTALSEQGKKPIHLPSRFAYFRDGSLYVMGTRVMEPNDTLLEAFVKKEQEKENQSTQKQPYLGFIDRRAPYKEGKIDADFIRSFGVTIPPKHYMALGDNHARSSDSRFFGFLPEQNLKGAPSWIFWPPGPRWGSPVQADYPFMNIPRAIIWSTALLGLALWWLYTRMRMRKRIYHP